MRFFTAARKDQMVPLQPRSPREIVEPQNQERRMRADDLNEAVQMLDLLLEFFADGVHWTRGAYNDGHGRRCLIGALDYLCREHHASSDAAICFLQEAMPRRSFGLVYFNDRRCRSFAELRSVIIRARALALGEEARERAAVVVERWLFAALDEERTAKLAVDDDRCTLSWVYARPEKVCAADAAGGAPARCQRSQVRTRAWKFMTREVDLCGR
jgi:hypothetical protein